MVAKFPYEKAILAIAEADLYGDSHACEKYGISRQTLWRWRDRARNEPTMSQGVTKKKKLLLHDWQGDAAKTLKTGLSELNRRFQGARDKDDAMVITAIAGAVKVIGDIKLEASIILTQDDGDSESLYQQTEEGEVAAESRGEEEGEDSE